MDTHQSNNRHFVQGTQTDARSLTQVKQPLLSLFLSFFSLRQEYCLCPVPMDVYVQNNDYMMCFIPVIVVRFYLFLLFYALKFMPLRHYLHKEPRRLTHFMTFKQLELMRPILKARRRRLSNSNTYTSKNNSHLLHGEICSDAQTLI